jgi:hypothetical protein
MKDRFDLEQDIMYCRNIIDDIDMLYENVCDKFDMPAETVDRIANILLGMKELYEMRFDRLEDTFCQAYQLNKYHTPEETETGWTGVDPSYQEYPESNSDYTVNVTYDFNDGTWDASNPVNLTMNSGDVDLWNTHNDIVTGGYTTDGQLSLKFS